MDDVMTGLRAVLVTTPARWTSLIAAVPDDLLRRAPAPGEWAAIDCLRHLRDAERDVFQVRFEAFRSGQDLVPYDPERDGSVSPGEPAQALAEDFARLRAASLEVLSDVTPEDLGITVIHGEYGPVQLGAMLHYWAAHDLMHTVQAERALMQPFITRSGAWRVMCADYDVGNAT
jgi:DinB superfamily